MNEIERVPVGDSLEDKYRKLQEEYTNVIQMQYHKDYENENLKKALENIKNTLENITKENRAMRELLSLWI
jgi:DNA-binding transcriptional regulator GbsR (MarR family)